MLEKLTPAQEAKIPEYVKKFLSLGLSTLGLNTFLEKELKKIIGDVYRLGGWTSQRKFFFINLQWQP